MAHVYPRSWPAQTSGSALRADELVQRGDRFATGDRDVPGVALPPGDAQLVECVREDLADVVRRVGEEVTRIGVALDRVADPALGPVGNATAVAVDQPADQRPRI